jgi:hypothetical protein
VPSLIEAQRYFGIPYIQSWWYKFYLYLLDDSFVLALVATAIACVEIRLGWLLMVCKPLVET